MYQLNPASIEDSEIYNQNNNQNKNIYKKPTGNRTLKNKNVSFLSEEIKKNNKDSINPKEVENKEKLSTISKLISNLHNSTEDDNNDDENFKLYNETMDNMTNLTNSNIITQELNKMNNHNDNNITANEYQNSKINKSFSHIDESYKVNSDFINTLNNSSNNLLNNNDLLNKLDYIIHLLEEQHNEKTNTINEELILYLFLGIFMIFVLDSFARASKYVR